MNETKWNEFFFTEGREKIKATVTLLQQMDRKGCGGREGADVSHRREEGRKGKEKGRKTRQWLGEEGEKKRK